MYYNLFKVPLDSCGDILWSEYDKLRKHFLDKNTGWEQIYDFVEGCVNSHPDGNKCNEFIEAANGLFIRECTAYRFVGNQITGWLWYKTLHLLSDVRKCHFTYFSRDSFKFGIHA